MRTPRTLIAVAAVAALTVLAPSAASAKPHDPPTQPTAGPCAYTPLADQTYSTWVGLPQDPRHTPDHGTVRITLRTNHGAIPLELDRALAPCTVQNFAFLTHQKYFDDTICHRLTAYRTPPVGAVGPAVR